MKQVNTILPDEEEPSPELGRGEGINVGGSDPSRVGTMAGDKVAVSASGGSVGRPLNPTSVAVARGTGGFRQT